MAARHGLNAKTKHLEIKLCCLQECVRGRDLSVHPVPSAQNPADMMTKWSGQHAIQQHLQEFCFEVRAGRAKESLGVSMNTVKSIRAEA